MPNNDRSFCLQCRPSQQACGWSCIVVYDKMYVRFFFHGIRVIFLPRITKRLAQKLAARNYYCIQTSTVKLCVSNPSGTTDV